MSEKRWRGRLRWLAKKHLNYDEMSDDELIALARDPQLHDTRALDCLITRHWRTIRYALWRLHVTDSQEVEDLIQVVGIALWTQITAVDYPQKPIVSIPAWLRAVTSHKVASYLRLIQRERVHLVRIDSLTGGPFLSDGLSLEERVLERLRAEAADATIMQLPPRELQAIALALDERSDDENAVLLGITKGNLQVRRSRARQHLKELMGD